MKYDDEHNHMHMRPMRDLLRELEAEGARRRALDELLAQAGAPLAQAGAPLAAHGGQARDQFDAGHWKHGGKPAAWAGGCSASCKKSRNKKKKKAAKRHRENQAPGRWQRSNRPGKHARRRRQAAERAAAALAAHSDLVDDDTERRRLRREQKANRQRARQRAQPTAAGPHRPRRRKWVFPLLPDKRYRAVHVPLNNSNLLDVLGTIPLNELEGLDARELEDWAQLVRGLGTSVDGDAARAAREAGFDRLWRMAFDVGLVERGKDATFDNFITTDGVAASVLLARR